MGFVAFGYTYQLLIVTLALNFYYNYKVIPANKNNLKVVPDHEKLGNPWLRMMWIRHFAWGRGDMAR